MVELEDKAKRMEEITGEPFEEGHDYVFFQRYALDDNGAALFLRCVRG